MAWGVSYATEPSPAQAFQAIPQKLSKTLDPQGVRLFRTLKTKKTEICDVWWSKQVAAQPAGKPAPDVTYGVLPPGTFIGVVSYLVPREDFQHHILRPGLYSMRYANLKQNPADETVSPFRDFVILSPVWAEKDPSTPVPLGELEKRGRMISHKDEPAMLSLMPVNPAYKHFPASVSDDRGFCMVQIMLRQQTGKQAKDLPVAIVVIRPPYENEGS
jgi:hypothetical protein